MTEHSPSKYTAVADEDPYTEPSSEGVSQITPCELGEQGIPPSLTTSALRDFYRENPDDPRRALLLDFLNADSDHVKLANGIDPHTGTIFRVIEEPVESDSIIATHKPLRVASHYTVSGKESQLSVAGDYTGIDELSGELQRRVTVELDEGSEQLACIVLRAKGNYVQYLDDAGQPHGELHPLSDVSLLATAMEHDMMPRHNTRQLGRTAVQTIAA
jgi:hypothetical protein